MDNKDQEKCENDVPEAKDKQAGQSLCYDSTELFGQAREVLIHHGDEVYRLRITRNGKLILQK